MTLADAYVVGTGRCGSTFVGELLADTRRFAVLHEAISLLGPSQALAPDLTPKELVELSLRRNEFLTEMLRTRSEPPEVRYAVDDPTNRYRRDAGIPALAVSALPGVSANPDALLDGLTSYLGRHRLDDAMGPGLLADAFAFVARSVGRKNWIERSGANLAYVDQLAAASPQARLIHVYRGGLAVAHSMGAHPAFQLSLDQQGDRPPNGRARPWGARTSAGGPNTENSGVARTHRFLRLWARQILGSMHHFAKIDPRRTIHIRYERLVADPGHELDRLASFVGLDESESDAWVRRSVSRVQSERPRPDAIYADERTVRLAEVLDRRVDEFVRR